MSWIYTKDIHQLLYVNFFHSGCHGPHWSSNNTTGRALATNNLSIQSDFNPLTGLRISITPLPPRLAHPDG